MNFAAEFDRQAENLIQKDYPELAGISTQDFLQLLEPLKQELEYLSESDVDLEKGHLPFVIVIKNNLVPTDTAMSQVEKDGKSGITKLFPHQPKDFTTLESVKVPGGIAYLLVDIDRGKENINLAPNVAMKQIHDADRSPLTIDEGVA